MRKPFFVANWKMNHLAPKAAHFAKEFPARVANISSRADIGIAPQAIHLSLVADGLAKTGVALVGQNCGQSASGAFTGEISPAAQKELGVQWVILGHSERRWVFGESDDLITARLKAALEADLSVILCVGERLAERKSGKTFEILEGQMGVLDGLKPADLARVVIAYEPVWAIGTGETATPAQAQEAHGFVRGWLRDHFSAPVAEQTRILYGGSAKADNAEALMRETEVDGLLVGGASLDPIAFAELIQNGLRSLA